jgi:predicted glycosyl hydrolase (DUF1957 family)
MKLLTLVLLISWTFTASALSDLKVGDVLLQPLDCWSCDLIEAEEQSIYSHIGVVISTSPVMVADSRRKVEIQTLEQFNSITEQGQKLRVIRFRNDEIVETLQKNAGDFLSLFKSEFEGLKYDHDFLWNNLDENGNQKLYCSEMIAKLFQAFLGIEPYVKRMQFERNPELWERYFHGNVPRGKWGNSPGDFEKSDLFYVVGDL